MAEPTRRLYSVLLGDEEHGCGDLPEEICAEVPRNAGRLVGALTLQRAGDFVVDAKTVLAWLLATEPRRPAAAPRPAVSPVRRRWGVIW